MLALSKLLKVPDRQAEYTELVDSLLQRVAESALTEDRREALVQLRDLLNENGDARAAFGSVGLPLICSLARDSRDDVDQLQTALECLSAAVSPEVRCAPCRRRCRWPAVCSHHSLCGDTTYSATTLKLCTTPRLRAGPERGSGRCQCGAAAAQR